jgi:hypothetical protein
MPQTGRLAPLPAASRPQMPALDLGCAGAADLADGARKRSLTICDAVGEHYALKRERAPTKRVVRRELSILARPAGGGQQFRFGAPNHL